jgi:Fusaric acid resistance protein family
MAVCGEDLCCRDACALHRDVDRPGQTILGVDDSYVIAHPLTGTVRSKAMFRLIGTVIGAAMTVALVPNLANAPELLSVALALWVGLCLYFALLDRSPRSYLFMLSGFTTVLIGFPAVTTPDAMWDIAVARVEEIGLGIICTTVISIVVFPRAGVDVERAYYFLGRACQHLDRGGTEQRRRQDQRRWAPPARGGCGRTPYARVLTQLRHVGLAGSNTLGGRTATTDGAASAAALLNR